MLGDAVAPVLEAHLRAAGGRLRGIRNSTAWHASDEVRSNPIKPPPGLLMEPAFRRGVGRLRDAGLSLDVWAYHPQLAEVVDLARAFPGHRHHARPLRRTVRCRFLRGQEGEVFRTWRGTSTRSLHARTWS